MGSSWANAGATAAPATLGTLASLPGEAPAALLDRRSVFEVVLAHGGMNLSSATARAVDAGANLALCGDELLQFTNAEQIGPARWRLSALLRGRRGTELAIGTQRPGDRFVLLETGAALSLDLPLATLGGTVRVLATGVGDVAGPVVAACAMRGASVLPPSPVALRWREIGGGDATIGWTRRSRAGWRWIDGVDAPLVEERERYRVTLAWRDGTRTTETDAPGATLAASERSGGTTVSVRQIGSFGDSASTSLFIPALEA